MNGPDGVATIFVAFFHIIEPFVAMALVGLGYWAVAELQRHGYQTTYASAIVRAMGAGVMAAQDRGFDPFSPEGRQIVGKVGGEYLATRVGEAGEALGIESTADHATRVLAQLGATSVQQAVLEVTSIGEGKLGIATNDAHKP